MLRSASSIRSALVAAAVAVLVMAGAEPMAAQTVAEAEAPGLTLTGAPPATSAQADGVASPHARSTPADAVATYAVAARDLDRGEVLTAQDIAYVAL